MKTSSILSALSAALAFDVQHASANCYEDGDTWPNKEVARSFVQDACFNNGGMFTGYYYPLQKKSMCPRDGGLGLVFDVQNLNKNAGFDLGDQDCYSRLNNEIFGCDHGGSSIVSGWYFKARPGAC